jgi:hypothetical protein
MDGESTPEVLVENAVSSKNSNTKKNGLLTAPSTATTTGTTKSPWQLLREKETAMAVLALESASPDKKKDKQDDDGQKKKKSSGNK